jgi:hypothetical protein
MRAVKRTDAPAALKSKDGKGAKELVAARAHIASSKGKAFPFAAYKDETVKLALERLFHGKCAYCETFYSVQAPVDVEHFRPKGAIEGEEKHPGYWWLGMEWQNLLPSCIDCNRRRRQPTPTPQPSLGALFDAENRLFNTGKKDAFPIAGRRAKREKDRLELESPYLIDPTERDPDEFLEYYIDPAHLVGLVLPRRTKKAPATLPALGDTKGIVAAAKAAGVSIEGAVSIQVYGLNRLGLVQARTRVLRQLEFLRQLIIDIDSVARSLEPLKSKVAKEAIQSLDQLIERVLREIAEMARPEAPYSALVMHWRRQFLDEYKI